MKILVIGQVHGDVDIVNAHLDRSGADIALVLGNLGIHKNKKYNFYDYLCGLKEFNKLVVAVRGSHDNIELCEKISNDDITVKNFLLLKDSITYNIPINYEILSLGGIGGTYSPISFDKKELFGNEKRHFTKKSVIDITKTKKQLIIMHDVIGEYKNKIVTFRNELHNMIKDSKPFYCLIGKYNFWSAMPMESYGCDAYHRANLVFVPFAKKGYFLIDTDNEWNSEGVRLDLCGDNK